MNKIDTINFSQSNTKTTVAPEKPEKYLELEKKFKIQVEQDKINFANQLNDSHYIPNPFISKKPKFCLVALEPSLPASYLLKKIEFLNTFRNFLIHFCSYRFLCNNSFDYHITDVSKSAMEAKEAGTHGIRTLVYKNWLPLLKDEMQILSGEANQSKPKIISIGKTVKSYLENSDSPFSVDYNVFHYSENNNARFKNFAIDNQLDVNLDFDSLFDNVREFGIFLMKYLHFTEAELENRLLPETGIFNKDKFSDSRKSQAIYRYLYYKTEFEKFSNQ